MSVESNWKVRVVEMQEQLTAARADNALLRREIDELRYALKEIVELGGPADVVTIARDALRGG